MNNTSEHVCLRNFREVHAFPIQYGKNPDAPIPEERDVWRLQGFSLVKGRVQNPRWYTMNFCPFCGESLQELPQVPQWEVASLITDLEEELAEEGGER